MNISYNYQNYQNINHQYVTEEEIKEFCMNYYNSMSISGLCKLLPIFDPYAECYDNNDILIGAYYVMCKYGSEYIVKFAYGEIYYSYMFVGNFLMLQAHGTYQKVFFGDIYGQVSKFTETFILDKINNKFVIKKHIFYEF